MVVQNSIEIDDNGSDDGYDRKKLAIMVTDLCPDCMKELEDFLNNKIKGAQTNERL